jgi:hypothetical protein
MSSQYEKRQLAKLNDQRKKRKLRKTRQKLGHKDGKENEPVEEEADEDWGNSINTTRSSLRSKVSTRNALSPEKTAQKDISADLNRSSGSTRAFRARRSEEWQVSNVSSVANKNEDVEEDSDSTEDKLVIDESQEIDPIQEAKKTREEIAELKAKMDEEEKRLEEESKKKLAELKAQAAQRKAVRKAKQEEKRRKLEEESSGESDSTLVNATNQSSNMESENNEDTLPKDKTVTIEQKKPPRRSKASIPVPNFESENQGKSISPLETSNISDFDPKKISTPKPSPMPSVIEMTESTANDGLGIQTSQTYHTQETNLTNSQNDTRTFVKPRPDLTRRKTKDNNSTKTIIKVDKGAPSDRTQVIEKRNKTKSIQKASSDETKILKKSNKKGKKRKSDSPEPSKNSSKSFQLSASNGSMPPLESSLGQNTSPVRNETFQSIQSSIQLSPSPKKKTPSKSPPKKMKSKTPVELPPEKESENEDEQESEHEGEQESQHEVEQDQESPVETKRKQKLTKKKSKTSENSKEKAPRKSRRSSIRFDKKERVHEIPSRYDLNEQEESDNDDVNEAGTSTSRRTSIASSARTLNRRSSDDESEDDTIVIDRRKGFKNRKVENAQKTWKHQFMAENIITPGTPEEGLRRSNRTRFKSHWVTGQVNTVSHVMLTDDMIKNGDFGFGQFQLNTPASIGKEATRSTLNLKTAKDRDPGAKKGRSKGLKKRSKKLNDTAADFKNLSDDDDLEHYVDLLTKEIEIQKGDTTANYEAFSLPDEQFFIDLVTRQRMNASNPSLTTQQIYVKTIVNIGDVTKGEMMFGARAFKEVSNTGSNTYIFTVVYGGFEIIINDQKRLVNKGITFVILPDLNYSIRNRCGKRAELSFIMTATSKVENPNFTKIDEDSSEFSSEGSDAEGTAAGTRPDDEDSDSDEV